MLVVDIDGLTRLQKSGLSLLEERDLFGGTFGFHHSTIPHLALLCWHLLCRGKKEVERLLLDLHMLVCILVVAESSTDCTRMVIAIYSA